MAETPPNFVILRGYEGHRVALGILTKGVDISYFDFADGDYYEVSAVRADYPDAEYLTWNELENRLAEIERLEARLAERERHRASLIDYSIYLQQAIEYHCQGRLVPDSIAEHCPHHSTMLNKLRPGAEESDG